MEANNKSKVKRIAFSEKIGKIHVNLTIGVDVGKARTFERNENMAFSGVKINGSGFIVTQNEARTLGLGTVMGLEKHIRPYRNGRDVMGISRDVMVIDLYGLPIEQVERSFVLVFQWLLEKVKPERNKKQNLRLREEWWLFDSQAISMREAIQKIPRYIVTSRTSKHRVFTFVDSSVLPDMSVVAITTDDAYILGILSSNIHRVWAKATGSWMGKRQVYIQKCFDTFPLLEGPEEQKEKIRDIVEKLDAHRKEVQKKYPKLSLTALYNVLELVQTGQSFTSKDRIIFEQGNVEMLRCLHEELDETVAEVYGIDVEAEESLIISKVLTVLSKKQ